MVPFISLRDLFRLNDKSLHDSGNLPDPDVIATVLADVLRDAFSPRVGHPRNVMTFASRGNGSPWEASLGDSTRLFFSLSRLFPCSPPTPRPTFGTLALTLPVDTTAKVASKKEID